MIYDLHAEIARATSAWLAANTVGIPTSILKPSLAELVQDRASEMITHCDDAERVAEIGNELYTLAERILGREIDSDNRRHDEREIRSIYNRMGGGDDER